MFIVFKLCCTNILSLWLINFIGFFIIALIWQLMRAYTLSVLTQLAKTGSPMIEKEIVTWVNNKLQNANKSSTLRGFQDHALSDGRIVIDLIDAIKPGTINYDVVKEGGDAEVILLIKIIIKIAL